MVITITQGCDNKLKIYTASVRIHSDGTHVYGCCEHALI